jgi:hypothetical protein
LNAILTYRIYSEFRGEALQVSDGGLEVRDLCVLLLQKSGQFQYALLLLCYLFVLLGLLWRARIA